MLRGILGCLIGVAVASCSSSDDAKHPPATGKCPDGFQRSGSTCEPILHEGDCPAGSMPMFGFAECQPVGWTECGEGFEPDPTGWGCRAVASDGPCPAGTMAKLGSADCQPVGQTSCPDGFEAAPSGWGCRDVSPTASCAGATRATLGSATCAPVGNCAAAFPPANATLFVDDDYTAAQLDASHFAAISDALAAASDGDVIAVEAGAYTHGLALTHAVTIVGRCAEQVIVDGSAWTEAGVLASGSSITATVSGLTLSGHLLGIQAKAGAKLTVQDVVVDTARDLGVFGTGTGTSVVVKSSVIRNTQIKPSDYGFGVNVESGATVEVDDTEIADNSVVAVFSLGTGSTAKLVGSIVRGTKPDPSGDFGNGVQAQKGGAVVVEKSAIAGNRTLGGYASGKGSSIHVSDSVIRDTQAGIGGQFGHALQADSGASLVVERSTLSGNRYISVFLFDAGTTAEVTDSVVSDTFPGPGATAGRAFSLQDGAKVTLHGSALVNNREYAIAFGGKGTSAEITGSLIRDTSRLDGAKYGWGINCSDGATLSVDGSTLEHNEEYGIAVGKGASAKVHGTIVRGTDRSKFVGPDDMDWKVQGIGVQEGGQLDVSSSLIADTRQIGMYVWDADGSFGQSHVTANGLIVRGTLPAEATGEGNAAGILIGLGTSASLTDVAVVENSTIGLLVTEPGSSATVTRLVARATKGNNQGVLGRGVGVQSGGALTLDAGALVDDAEIALFVSEAGTTATVSKTYIADTRAAPPDGSGRGIGVQFGAALTLSQSTIVRSVEAGVHVVGAGALGTFTDVLIGDTAIRPTDSAFGYDVIVQDGGQLDLARSRVYGSGAVGLAFSASTGSLELCLLDHNPVAIHVQDGSSLVTSPTGAPNSVFVSNDSRFVENQTRVGSGTLPLPDPGVSSAQ